MAFLNLSQKIWAWTSLVLLTMFLGLLYWSFDVKSDLSAAQVELKNSKSLVENLKENIDQTRQMYENNSKLFAAKVDSLTKRNKLLTLQLNSYVKTIADINRKYDKIYTKIDVNDDFDQQLKYNQELLSVHGQLFHPKP